MASKARTSPRIDAQAFVAVMWTGIAISLSFLAFRIFVRIKAFRRIYADDLLVIFAWLMFLVSAVIWQWQLTAMYQQFTFASGAVRTPKQQEAQKSLLRSEVVTISFYFTSLWLIKLSFLIFFRRLGRTVRPQCIWWWCVTGLTVATWATCIGTMSFKCLLGSLDYIFAQCGPSARKYNWATLDYTCAADVISDAAIITIPILMLWNVQIPWKKKIALMSIFSLTIIVMFFSIVRVAVVTTKNSKVDMTWLAMWSNIELAISIVVSCLASFRQLYIMSDQSGSAHTSQILSSWRSRLRSAFKLPKTRRTSGNQSSSTRSARHHGAVLIRDSTEYMVPLDTVYVSRKGN